MSDRSPVKISGLLLFLAKLLIVGIIFLIPIFPGYQAQNGTSIVSIVHKPADGEDVFTIVADGPLPSPFFSAGNQNLEMEFRGVSCIMPLSESQVFVTEVAGTVADRLFVELRRKPFGTFLRLRLVNGKNYSYSYNTLNPRMFQLRLSSGIVESVEKVQPSATSGFQDQFTLEITPSPPRSHTPQKQKDTVGKTYTINRVEYLPLGEKSDSVSFRFSGKTSDPVIELSENPGRLLVKFPDCRVKLPGSGSDGPFKTDIPGRLLSSLVARNTETRGKWSAQFEFPLDDKINASWKRDDKNENLIVIEVSPLSEPRPYERDRNRYERIDPVIEHPGPEVPPFKYARKGSVISPFTIAVPEIRLELDWPVDREKILRELDRITADMFPGTSAAIPVRLKLRIVSTDEEPPPIVFKGDKGNIRKYIK